MKKKVLIVDDSVAILEVVKMTLEMAGYEVVTSLTGECFQQMEKESEPALQLSENDLPDLILLDILLSGEDGRAICERLKSNEKTRYIPVILISAHAGLRKAVDECGANDFLAKPFRITDLRNIVKKYLMNKREIHFPNGNLAQVILPPAGSLAPDLLRTLDIPQPDAVIIIAGGASEMHEQVHLDLIRLFTRGIAEVAASTRALIIDGGTQVGVMAIMGQEVARQGRRSMLLGVAPAGSVTYPGQPAGIKGNEAVPLDPNHSHFVLVETEEWGGETDTMYELAKVLSAGRPSLAVLINGGSIAKSEVLHNVRQRRPIIVMEGSGRLADKIARLWQEKPSSISDPQLAEVILDGDIHVFPLAGSTMELVQLTQDLLARPSGQGQARGDKPESLL